MAAKREFDPAQTRIVAYVKQIVLADRSGKRVVKVELMVELPQWVNPKELVMLQGQLADVYMEAVPLETAKEILYDGKPRPAAQAQ